VLVLVPNEDGNPAIDIVTVHNGLDFDPKKQAGPKGVKVEPGDKVKVHQQEYIPVKDSIGVCW
jgi:hypothetical protein